jgi:hypothetical protein
MGTDVRFFIEYRNSDKGDWIGIGEFYPSRNSDLISELSLSSVERGFPEKYSVDFFERAFIYIAKDSEIKNCIGDKFCTKELSEEWIQEYKSTIYHSDRAKADWILDPEFESTNWMYFSEFSEALKTFTPPTGLWVDYCAIYESMRIIEERCGRNSTRIIMWYC